MPNISIRLPSINQNPGPFRVMAVCHELDCEFYKSEVPGVDWKSTALSAEAMDSVMMYPYVFINKSDVIDVRCAFCIYCEKFDMKKEIQVVETRNALEGK